MLFVEKEANTLSTLRIVLKAVQEKLYPPADIIVSLAAMSPTPTFGQV